jgi:hypothetical protein
MNKKSEAKRSEEKRREDKKRTKEEKRREDKKDLFVVIFLNVKMTRTKYF